MSAVSPDWEMATTRCLRVEQRPAVAELAGVVDFDRDAGQLLDQELAHQAGVPGGAAGDQHRLADRRSFGRVQAQVLQAHPRRVADEPAPERVQQGPGLLVDLLEHEVAVAAPGRAEWVVGHGLEGPVDGRAVQPGDASTPPGPTTASSPLSR